MTNPSLNDQSLGKRQEVLDEASLLIDEILAGKEDVELGANKLFFNILGQYDFNAEIKKYVYDSIGLERAYGLLDTCMDLRDSDHQWEKKRSNEQLLEEVRIELFEQLQQWHQGYRLTSK